MMTDGRFAKVDDVWSSNHRETTITAAWWAGGRKRIKYKGRAGKEMSAWEDVYLRKRVLVMRDGQAVKPATPDPLTFTVNDIVAYVHRLAIANADHAKSCAAIGNYSAALRFDVRRGAFDSLARLLQAGAHLTDDLASTAVAVLPDVEITVSV